MIAMIRRMLRFTRQEPWFAVLTGVGCIAWAFLATRDLAWWFRAGCGALAAATVGLFVAMAAVYAEAEVRER